jgi:hypothetical protein
MIGSDSDVGGDSSMAIMPSVKSDRSIPKPQYKLTEVLSPRQPLPTFQPLEDLGLGGTGIDRFGGWAYADCAAFAGST